jgi:hypothetical protein
MSGTTGLTMLAAIVAAFVPAVLMAAPPGKVAEANFPLLSDEESWQKLPPTQKGGGQALPSWVRALAGPMPRTTAALLRLDLVQRTPRRHAFLLNVPIELGRTTRNPMRLVRIS